MWIHRDISDSLKKTSGVYVHILIGPRQCGKSSLFVALGDGEWSEVSFDDFQMRTLAEQDPVLFLSQQTLPLVIDEIQYCPNVFPEIKRIVDELKKERLSQKRPGDIKVIFRLTSSNQILLDQKVKETLVGRASYFNLNTLSVHEIFNAFPSLPLKEVLFRGGWPELYTNPTLDPIKYLNDYIRNYIEKDIVLSAGILKRNEFHTVLGMLAARTANILNQSSLAKDSGVRSVTIEEWVSVLEQTAIVYLLPPLESNLNKRLTRSPKIYLLDSGLAVRLQGWGAIDPLLTSPQAGALFETLVLAEIVKCISNFGKNWRLFLWRTKDGEEVDFIIDNGKGEYLALDAKLSMHGAFAVKVPPALSAALPQIKYTIIVTYSGKKAWLSKESLQLPIKDLTHFLLEWSD